MAGIASSLAQIPACARSSHPDRHLEPRARRQASQEDEGTQSVHRACTARRGGRDDQEGHNLSIKGSGAMVFKSNMHGVRFPKSFQAPNGVIKYDGQTNHNVWLEDYRLACKVCGADDDLFIIQFLPFYLVDTTRVWLDHLSKNTVDSWEDLKEIFTNNF
jgi:hypothetical protein